MTSARQPVTTQKSRMPAAIRPSKICPRTGWPRTWSIGLGTSSVSSFMRVPFPAARITAFIGSWSFRLQRSRPELVEHLGVGLHQADQILRLEDPERPQVRAGLGEPFQLVRTRERRV